MKHLFFSEESLQALFTLNTILDSDKILSICSLKDHVVKFPETFK